MPRMCVFDVSETLLDLSGLDLHLERAFDDASARRVRRVLEASENGPRPSGSGPGPAWRLDHLFDHLSVSVYGVPCGSTDLPKSGNRLPKGLHGLSRGPGGTYVS